MIINEKKDNKGKKNKSKKRFKTHIKWILLLMISIAGLMNQTIANKVVDNVSHNYAVKKIDPKAYEDNNKQPATFDADQVTALTSADMVGSNYTNLPLIGGMAIPDVGMNLGIFKGLSNANLSVGAGTMKEDQRLGVGNYALASHSLFSGYFYEGLLFTPLHRVQQGQKIYMHDGHKLFTYEITSIFDVNPNDGYVIDDTQGEGLVTLVTCRDLEATKRLIVRGKLIDHVELDKAPENVREYFKRHWTRWW